ncbi:pyridoxal kinase [Roseibium aquae]|uniref:pyridoxal kinase n=1 Tax=Roseibium aquae TaxID=1323746 RepID=A0A916WY16_9HYPH|nr:pyridoxal kinase [Roseibium aquae]GGB38587.1 pyridoxal kinase [Roseibium aquae]
MVTLPDGSQPDKAPLLVITSQVVRGGISGRGLVFALQRLGHPVWFVPTILLPWHPGHGLATRIVPPEDQFAALIADLAGSAQLAEIGGIITGYLGAAHQAGPIAELVSAVRARNPAAPYLCDPVIGDHGGLYVPEATAEAIRDQLLPLADIVTPNRFELSWLSGFSVESELEALAAARSLGRDRVLVTSAPALRRNAISNLLVGPTSTLAAEHAAVPNPPHGTGDILAGLFLSRWLTGFSDEEALVRAAASTFELIARTVRKGEDELLIAEEQQSLLRPMALVSQRRVIESVARA